MFPHGDRVVEVAGIEPDRNVLQVVATCYSMSLNVDSSCCYVNSCGVEEVRVLRLVVGRNGHSDGTRRWQADSVDWMG